tara:strand:- start:193 stop:993 length:801 start_codon:yes stop_codon:yes gene_type:complete
MSCSKIYSFCNNCGKNGHVFHHCKHPITSIGIITFRNTNRGLEYLMIRRKDSLGFVDFMRGKYSIYNKLYILNIINEMTISEKNKLLNNTFEELWKKLWGDTIGIQYRSEEKNSKEKFEQLKLGINNTNNEYTLSSLIKESNTKWNEPEWGFPKGRRNYQEKDIIAALREFEEETGYSKNSLHIIQNFIPIEEIFTGSNYKSYKHKYYLAHMNTDVEHGDFQDTEVSKLQWFTFSETINYIRPYNLEKISVIKQVNNILTKYQIYI